MAWVYILRCRDDSPYVGTPADLEGRVRQHQEGISSAHTSKRRPVTLVYTELLWIPVGFLLMIGAVAALFLTVVPS